MSIFMTTFLSEADPVFTESLNKVTSRGTCEFFTAQHSTTTRAGQRAPLDEPTNDPVVLRRRWPVKLRSAGAVAKTHRKSAVARLDPIFFSRVGSPSKLDLETVRLARTSDALLMDKERPPAH